MRVQYTNMPADDSGKPIHVLSKLTQFKFNPSRRTIGMEVECSSYLGGHLVNKAVADIGGAVVSDGSVLDGFEINTPPMNGDVFVYAAQNISEALIAAQAKSNAKSSVHVHIGCTDMSYYDIRHLVMLYGRLESGLYSIIDPRRFSADYSKPCGGRELLTLLDNPLTARTDLIEMVYNKAPDRTIRDQAHRKTPSTAGRYWGLNLHSWFHRGTVEFRAHHGTVQWEKMVGWSMLLCAIADGAIKYSESTIREWPQGLEGLKRIAPTPWVRDWIVRRWDKFAAKRNNKFEPITDF